jgi:uncharacterized membrane protein YoaK (UPF0700 family)
MNTSQNTHKNREGTKMSYVIIGLVIGAIAGVVFVIAKRTPKSWLR